MYDHRHSSLLVLHYLISSLLLRTHVNDGNHLREERDRPAAGQKDTGLDRRKDATRPYTASVYQKRGFEKVTAFETHP